MRTSPLILVPHQTYEVGQVERLSMKRNEKDQTIFTKKHLLDFFLREQDSQHQKIPLSINQSLARLQSSTTLYRHTTSQSPERSVFNPSIVGPLGP